MSESVWAGYCPVCRTYRTEDRADARATWVVDAASAGMFDSEEAALNSARRYSMHTTARGRADHKAFVMAARFERADDVMTSQNVCSSLMMKELGDRVRSVTYDPVSLRYKFRSWDKTVTRRIEEVISHIERGILPVLTNGVLADLGVINMDYVRKRYNMPWLSIGMTVSTPEGEGIVSKAGDYVYVVRDGQEMPWHPSDVTKIDKATSS